MARSKAYWRGVILAAFAGEAADSGVTSTSAVAEWNLWVNVVALCMVALDGFFDFFKSDVDTNIATMKAHTEQWYSTKAKAFQYGVTLPPDTDIYAVVPPVDTSVLIIANAATVEFQNLLRIKVAKLSGGVLAALDSGELTAFKAYMGRVKDAGVRLQMTSGAGDNLQVKMIVYYDPLVLTYDGKRIDGTNDHPTLDALKAFLTQLPFNGLFVRNSMVDYVQTVDGVRIVTPTVVQANYGATPYVDIPTEYKPDAGYLVLDETYFNANVTYVAHGEI
jgi:hypothetical protein